jgi:hypothetical protein
MEELGGKKRVCLCRLKETGMLKDKNWRTGKAGSEKNGL